MIKEIEVPFSRSPDIERTPHPTLLTASPRRAATSLGGAGANSSGRSRLGALTFEPSLVPDIAFARFDPYSNPISSIINGAFVRKFSIQAILKRFPGICAHQEHPPTGKFTAYLALFEIESVVSLNVVTCCFQVSSNRLFGK